MDNHSYITNQDIIFLLCQRLNEYRLAARISQREMAEKSGVSLTTISHLEQGVNQNITFNNSYNKVLWFRIMLTQCLSMIVSGRKVPLFSISTRSS